ncbi:MAG: hypothetical protein IK151_00780 [Erysipelotrichaceae bacterium]|nr:hypothetical protein [Erysipelotrichaceae bacterium]
MNNNLKKITSIFLSAILTLSLTVPVRVFADDEEPPVNEEPVVSEEVFVEEETKEEEQIKEEVPENEETPEEPEYGLGYKSPLFDYSDNYVVHRNRSLRGAKNSEDDQGLPEKYTAPHTSIKNQGAYGTCWAHAAAASAESTYLQKTGISLDLSELHLAYFFYHNLGVEDPLKLITNGGFVGVYEDLQNNLFAIGGSSGYAADMLNTGVGFAIESDLPYSMLDGNPYSLERFNTQLAAAGINPAEMCYGATDYYVSDIYYFDAADTQTIKEALIKNGAIAVSYYAEYNENDYYNKDKQAYYCYEDKDTNHAVTIVGYDDTFSKENFIVKPKNDGAWLIKNSWGTDNIRDNGYFWLSYEDVSFLTSLPLQLFIEPVENLRLYQHNASVGCFQYLNEEDPKTVKIANVFTAQDNEEIKKIVYNVSVSNTETQIRVYRNIKENPEDGELLGEYSVSDVYAGTHTLNLEKPLYVGKDEKFSIVAIQKNISGADIAYVLSSNFEMEDYWARFIENLAPGNGLYYENGKWNDLYNYKIDLSGLVEDLILTGCAAHLKAFAVPVAEKQYEYESKQTGPIEWTIGDSNNLTLTFTRNILNDRMIDDFVKAEVDNIELNKDDYVLSTGSLNVALSDSFINTLTKGVEHTLTVYFKGGASASQKFMIKEKVVPTVKPEDTAPKQYVVPITGIE